MPAGGELAALFARRKVADDDTNNPCDNAKEDAVIPAAASSDSASNGAPPAPRPAWQTPKKSQASAAAAPPSSTPKQQQPSRSPPRPRPAATTPPPSAARGEPVKVATPAENEELKAKFENRDMEAGIPTPSFLLNARANLKKSADKAGSTDSDANRGRGAVKAAAAAISAAEAFSSSGKNGSVKSTATKINVSGVGSSLGLNAGLDNSEGTKKFVRAASEKSASSVTSPCAKSSYFSSAGGAFNKTSSGHCNISNDSNQGTEPDAKKKHDKGSAALPTSGYAKSNSSSSAGGGRVNNSYSPDISETPKKFERGASASSDLVKGGSFSSPGEVGTLKNGSRNVSGNSSDAADANKKYGRAASLTSSLGSKKRGNDSSGKTTADNSENNNKNSAKDDTRSSHSSGSNEKIETAASSTSAKSSRRSFPSVGSKGSTSINNLGSMLSTCSSSEAGNIKDNSGNFRSGSASTCSSKSGLGKKSLRGGNLRSSSAGHDAPVDEATASLAGATNAAKGEGHSRSNSDGSSNNGAITSSSKIDLLAARRHRMVSSRGAASASSILGPSKYNEASVKQKKTSPGSLRREKMLARVRASQTGVASGNGKGKKGKKPRPIATNFEETNSSAGASFDASKTSIISPMRDEFEVLFADDENLRPFSQCSRPSNDGAPTQRGTNPLNYVESNKSIDSISNEVLHLSTDTSATAATMPTNNIKPKGHVSIGNAGQDNITPIKARGGVNSQQSRLHNASTPKIRGSSTHRRSYEIAPGGAGESVSSTGGGSGSWQQQQAQAQGSQQQQQEQQHQNTCMQSFQQQQIEAARSGSQSEDYLNELQQLTPRRHSQDIPQSYPLRQSPSQLSQMSAITTPSCFPQEFNAAPLSTQSNMMGHLQQPMLVGGPIHEIYETASTGSTHNQKLGGGNGQGIGSGEMGGGGGHPIGTSAFSSGRDLENRRLREELVAVKKKLEEKDAIISQLMKRIGDLESMNSGAMQQHPHNVNANPSLSSNPLVTTLSSTSNSVQSNGGGGSARGTPLTNGTGSFAMSSLWDHSQPAFHSATGAFQQQRSRSHDTESLSVPSSAPVVSGMAPQSPTRSGRASSASQQQHIRSGSSGGGDKNSFKMSPNTTSTTSTSSVTTANSSRSNDRSKSSGSGGGGGRKMTPRSRSISGDVMNRKSPHRRASASAQKANDERKFVC